MWEVARACGLCGSSRHRRLFRVHRKGYVQCADCATARLYDRVAAERLDCMYDAFCASQPRVLEERDLAIQLANPTFACRRRRLEERVPAGRRELFEIGCGDGNFLAYMRGRGWQVRGCEYGSRTREFVRSRHGIEVSTGDFTTLPIEAGSLETIGAYMVLEHLYEPLDWIRTVRRALRTGGFLHLQVPNFRCLDRYVAGRCWSLLSFPEHVYFYEPAGLKRRLEREGFRVVGLSTYDPWHGPGTTLSSARSCAMRLFTGRLPWPEVAGADTPGTDGAGGAQGPGATRKKKRTLIFDTLGQPVATLLARAQSLIGYGNVLDVMARATTSPEGDRDLEGADA
ncbi:MAG: class I SAM-dependent methyltransferase [Candidatus Rokubacteria bacterium]|nr:class I SAM-dependent methyltransferase [Candidatus Rokubacteria bacterium]